MSNTNDMLGAAAHHFEQNRALIPMYIHILLSALFPIYAGAHASLSRPSSAAKPRKRTREEDDEGEEEEEEEETLEKMEGLTPKDAIIFPVTAGLVLSALYFAIKTYGAGIINQILGAYFSLIGTYSVAKLFNDSWIVLASFVTPTYYYDQGKVWKLSGRERKAAAIGVNEAENGVRPSPLAGPLGRVSLPETFRDFTWEVRDLMKQRFVVEGYAKDVFDFRAIFTRLNVLSAVLGITAVGYSVFVDKPWWLTNLQGFAVCYGALQLMSPTTFLTGTLILSGLFFYDIWAVFFTPLMVTVAKNLDVPIKLVFPRPYKPSTEPGKPPVRGFSMLGLGDIVLPGLMIALALRFDLYMYYLRKQTTSDKATAQTKESQSDADDVGKAPWIPVTGHWGDRFWTARLVSSPESNRLPESLTTSFPKPYFTACVIGYVVGMLATLIFMSVFQHAQPALLYLVPAVLTSLWGTGFARGELKHLWEFTESIDGQPENEGKDEKVEAEATGQGKETSQWWTFSYFSDLLPGRDKTSAKNSSSSKISQQESSSKAVVQSEHDGQDKKSPDTDKKPKLEEVMHRSVGPDVVFSLAISRHKQNANDASDDPAPDPTGQSSPGVESDAKHGPSDSLSSDEVLMSSSDLSGQD